MSARRDPAEDEFGAYLWLRPWLHPRTSLTLLKALLPPKKHSTGVASVLYSKYSLNKSQLWLYFNVFHKSDL